MARRLTEEDLFEALDHGICVLQEWDGELRECLRVLGIDRHVLNAVLEERWAAARDSFKDIPLSEAHKRRLYAAGAGEGLLMGVQAGRRST